MTKTIEHQNLKQIDTSNLENINRHLKRHFGYTFDKRALERHVKKEKDFLLGMVTFLEEARVQLEKKHNLTSTGGHNHTVISMLAYKCWANCVRLSIRMPELATASFRGT